MTVIPLKKLNKIVDQSLVEWLGAEGFVLEKGFFGGTSVYRWQDDVYINIMCEVRRIGGENQIVPFAQMGFLHIKRIYTHFMADSPEDAEERNQRAVNFQVDYQHYMQDWNARIPCQYEEELEGAIATLKAFIFDYLYPTVMTYTDPEKLATLYYEKDEANKTTFKLPGWHGYSSALSGLILARLHKPEHYLELKKRYQPILYDPQEPPDEITERFDRLITYLDQKELKPLRENQEGKSRGQPACFSFMPRNLK